MFSSTFWSFTFVEKNFFWRNCVKSVQNREFFFWSLFFLIWNGYGDLLCKSLYSFRIWKNTDQYSTKLVNQCISEHAPTKRTKFTRPPAPWLKGPEIFKAKNVLDNLRTKSRDLNHSDLTFRQNYQTARNLHKKQLD